MNKELAIKQVESYVHGRVGLVHVVTESGADGWGQMAPANADISQTVLHRQVAPLVIDRDATDRNGISTHVIESTYKFPGTYICRALAGVDTALWDLYGKLEGQPVARLLGAESLRVPAYASSMSRKIKPVDEAQRMQRLADENGFRAFKVRIGKRMGHDVDERPGRTEELIVTMRSALGPDARLLVDANGGFSVDRAIQTGQLLQDHGYAHYEEPCPYYDIESLAAVAAALNIPIAAGEQDYDLLQWQRIFDLGSADIAQPDICYVGGFTRALQVCNMAAEKNISIVPHSANKSLVQIFAAHLMAGIRNAGPHLEYCIEPRDWALGMYSPRLEVTDGAISINDAPGWGISISASWLNKAQRQATEK